MLVLGYLAMGFVPRLTSEEAESRDGVEMLRAGAAQLEAKDPQAAAALRADGSSMRTPPFLWPGRIAFLAGLGLVAVAGVRWYRLAQQPEVQETEKVEVDEETEG